MKAALHESSNADQLRSRNGCSMFRPRMPLSSTRQKAAASDSMYGTCQVRHPIQQERVCEGQVVPNHKLRATAVVVEQA